MVTKKKGLRLFRLFWLPLFLSFCLQKRVLF
jgi:hypothetical protein